MNSKISLFHIFTLGILKLFISNLTSRTKACSASAQQRFRPVLLIGRSLVPLVVRQRESEKRTALPHIVLGTLRHQHLHLKCPPTRIKHLKILLQTLFQPCQFGQPARKYNVAVDFRRCRSFLSFLVCGIHV